MKLEKVEEGIVPIYENEAKEKLINARELHEKIGSKTKFSDWIKRRIEYYKFKKDIEKLLIHQQIYLIL